MIEAPEAPPDSVDRSVSLLELILVLARHVKLLVIGPLVVGVLAFGFASTIKPTFTSRTSFLPPQQQQSSATAALSSLGALAGLAGGGGFKSPADQYVALMQSVNVSDRLIDQFKLMNVYAVDYLIAARKTLEANTRIVIGKKDGLISIEVDDKDPKRAAAIANQYVEELRRLTSTLAVTEAQQRRVFFERQLQQTKERLTLAQQALQSVGFSQGALRSEPRAAAESYARVKAELTATEVRLQTLRGSFSDAAPEVQRGLATAAALRAQLDRLERAEAPADTSQRPDYVSRFREFKYLETLFDLFARQYEVARIDESREGALIQVVDVAQPPELKSRPKRAQLAVGATIAAALLLVIFVLLRHAWRRSTTAGERDNAAARVRSALTGR